MINRGVLKIFRFPDNDIFFVYFQNSIGVDLILDKIGGVNTDHPDVFAILLIHLLDLLTYISINK